MARRDLLHKNKVPELKEWLDRNGFVWREGRGDWQIMQIQIQAPGWHVLFERLKMPEHVTVPDPLLPLIYRFIREYKNGIQSRDTIREAVQEEAEVRARHAGGEPGLPWDS